MRFVVEPRLLDHFGVAMYNTLDKAIAELVANGYDAEATEVDVTLGDDTITIADNGRGMTAQEVQDTYLRLGRDRRAEGKETSGKLRRPVIGHKGIGKLAGLGIAEKMVITTTRKGEQTRLTIDRTALDGATSLEAFDLGEEITEAKGAANGTRIELQGLLIELEDDAGNRLREHLAIELPPAKAKWKVTVDGVQATVADIPGDRFEIDDEIEGYGRVKGFYKIVKREKNMPAGFAIRIRGRVVQSPTLFGLNQQTHGFFSLTRIVGELRPDFIDGLESNDPEGAFDINTSRTGLNPASPRVAALIGYAENKLTDIADGLSKQRTNARKEAAKKRNPDLEARMKQLGPDVYQKLDEHLTKIIAQLAKNESNKTIDELADIIVRYYESDALRKLVDSIRDESDADIERLANLLSQFGATRVMEVAQLLHSQLIVIESLRKKVNAGELEADIHEVIAKNIWLFREPLTYWFDNKAFSTQLGDRLASEFGTDKLKRPDLVCYDNSKLASRSDKRLVVIEFKRPGVEIGALELTQVMRYKSIFRSSLSGYDNESIEVVILGDRFDSGFDREALADGYTIMSYVELLDTAKRRYQELYERLVPEGAEVPGVVTSELEEEEEEDPLTPAAPAASRRRVRPARSSK